MRLRIRDAGWSYAVVSGQLRCVVHLWVYVYIQTELTICRSTLWTNLFFLFCSGAYTKIPGLKKSCIALCTNLHNWWAVALDGLCVHTVHSDSTHLSTTPVVLRA